MSDDIDADSSVKTTARSKKAALQLTLRLAIILLLCSVILTAKAAESGKWRPLTPLPETVVELKKGSSRPPVLCVHTLGGNISQFEALAQYLAPGQPVYGIKPAHRSNDQSINFSIQSSATDVANAIRSLEMPGPYVMCGFSSGGAIALAAAAQLKEQSDSLVVMFDSHNPAIENKSGYLERIGDLIQRGWHSLWNMPFSKLWNESYDFVRRMWSYWEYEPQVAMHRVLLFQSSSSLEHSTDPKYGWGEVAIGGMDIEVIESDHRGLLMEPVVRETAQRLQAYLDDFCLTAHCPQEQVR